LILYSNLHRGLQKGVLNTERAAFFFSVSPTISQKTAEKRPRDLHT